MTGRVDADDATRDVVRTYDRMAPLYDALDAVYEWSWKRRLRTELFTFALPGRLLDAGVGTGCNMCCYPPGTSVTGIDSSPNMLAEAQRRAFALRRPVDLQRMNLLRLDLPDACFDTVVATFVLLCLPERHIPAALAELVRVCRPGGRVLLLDYRQSSHAAMRVWQKILSPWLRWAFAGRYDAGTERYVEDAGLRILERRTYAAQSISMVVAERN